MKGLRERALLSFQRSRAFYFSDTGFHFGLHGTVALGPMPKCGLGAASRVVSSWFGWANAA